MNPVQYGEIWCWSGWNVFCECWTICLMCLRWRRGLPLTLSLIWSRRECWHHHLPGLKYLCLLYEMQRSRLASELSWTAFLIPWSCGPIVRGFSLSDTVQAKRMNCGVRSAFNWTLNACFSNVRTDISKMFAKKKFGDKKLKRWSFYLMKTDWCVIVTPKSA